MAWQRQLLLRERHRRARALGTDSELRVCALFFVGMQSHASLRKENMRKEDSAELIAGRASIAVRVEGVRVEGGGHLKLDAGVKNCVHDHVCSRARLFATACMCCNLRSAQAIFSIALTLPMLLS